MNYKISDKDIRDWNTFLKSEDKIPNKDLEKKKINTLETKSIDLHGFSLEEANEFVETFINKSFKDGVRKLIIVTGKGLHSKNEADPFVSKDLSILKYSVPEFIKNNEMLMKKLLKLKKQKQKMVEVVLFMYI